MATDTMGAASGGASSRRQGLSCPPLPHHRAFYAVALVVFCSLSFTARQTQPLTASDRALGAASSSSVSSSLLLNTLRGATTTRPSTATSPQPTTTYKPLAAANVPVMPPVVVEAKLGDVRGDPSYCRHGGLELDHGRCICGRGTQGLRCEGINASLLAKVQDYGVCGPGCWGIYVWYPTAGFNFRSLKQARAHGDDRYAWYERKLLDFLAWQDGGEVRLPVPSGSSNSSSGSSSGSSKAQDLVVVPDVWTSLGPWSPVDKQMIAAFHEYRQHAARKDKSSEAVVLPSAAAVDKSSTDGGKKSKKATIVFGLMLHDDIPRFQALWQTLFSEEHYYIIHLDARLEEKPATGPAAAAASGGRDEASEDKDQRRQEILAIIAATPLSSATASVWDRVHFVEEAASMDSLWGDITLVYSEVLLWLRLNQQVAHWEWDYYINLSGSDIPIVPLDAMAEFFQPYLAAAPPAPSTSWFHSHETGKGFRQTYVLPEKESHKLVVAFDLRQNETNFGRYRAKWNMTRLLGCSQWHILHRTMLNRLVATPEVEGFLYSLKHTSIPDESFFASAAHWLVDQYPEELSIINDDLRYVKENRYRNLAAKGELRKMMEEARNGQALFARKSKSAIITCAYTNKLMGLQHDCSVFNNTGVFPPDALYDDPPPRPADAKSGE